MFSGSVNAGFVLALPFHHEDLERDCAGVEADHEARGGEMLPTLAVGWRASALRGEEAGCFREVAGMSIVLASGPRSR